MEKQQNLTYSIIDFSQSPGPRYCSQGDDSGEKFYHTALNKEFVNAYNAGAKLVVTLDGADGYASSFLDEAFGNLVYDFSEEVVRRHLEIVSNDEEVWKDMIMNETLPEWEKRRNDKLKPRKTANHEKWTRLVEGELKDDIWK